MKRITILIMILVMTQVSFAGGDKKYTKAMEANIQALYDAESADAFGPIANKFTRIGEAEKDMWLPYYYASLAEVFKSFRITDVKQKDLVLDQAQCHLAKAAVLEQGNSEITALEGFIYMLKISVDPGTRGQLLAPKAMGSFGTAMTLDPQNPRATLFMGQMQMGTAQFFGSGIEEACAMIDLSVKLFEEFKPQNSISPIWGKGTAIEWQQRCNTQPTGNTQPESNK